MKLNFDNVTLRNYTFFVPYHIYISSSRLTLRLRSEGAKFICNVRKKQIEILVDAKFERIFRGNTVHKGRISKHTTPPDKNRN